MIPQELYAVGFFFGGCISFLLLCWWICHYVDSEKNFISRKCRRKEEEYYRSERKHYKRRKDLGKLL